MMPPDLRHIFTVDLAEGKLFWHRPPGNHSRLFGREAGSPRSSGSGKLYWHIKIGGRAYKRSHLIFAWVNGRMPSPCVDHIDGNSLNDRPANLREATALQNAWNHKKRARRIDLPMGVRRLASGRFQARIALEGRQIHLGAFDTPQQAAAAYQTKRGELYGEFA